MELEEIKEKSNESKDLSVKALSDISDDKPKDGKTFITESTPKPQSLDVLKNEETQILKVKHEDTKSSFKTDSSLTKLDLYNFTDSEFSQNCPYVLTSPRSLKACANKNVRPIDLLPEEFDAYKEQNPLQANRLTLEGLKRLWQRSEETKIILLNQCRAERARLRKFKFKTQLSFSKKFQNLKKFLIQSRCCIKSTSKSGISYTSTIPVPLFISITAT